MQLNLVTAHVKLPRIGKLFTEKNCIVRKLFLMWKIHKENFIFLDFASIRFSHWTQPLDFGALLVDSHFTFRDTFATDCLIFINLSSFLASDFFRSTRAKTFSPFARKTENEKPFFQSTQRKRRIFRERDFPHQHKRIGDVEREIHSVEFHRLAMVCNRDSAQFSSLSAYFDNSRITPQVFPRWKSCSGLEKLQSSLSHPHINLPEAIEKERCVVTQS